MKLDQKQNDKTIVKSPCVSNCCLDEQDICLGCFRHIDQITGWHAADNNTRRAILEETERRKIAKAQAIKEALAKNI